MHNYINLGNIYLKLIKNSDKIDHVRSKGNLNDCHIKVLFHDTISEMVQNHSGDQFIIFTCSPLSEVIRNIGRVLKSGSLSTSILYEAHLLGSEFSKLQGFDSVTK